MQKAYPCFGLTKNMQMLNMDFNLDAYYFVQLVEGP